MVQEVYQLEASGNTDTNESVVIHEERPEPEEHTNEDPPSVTKSFTDHVFSNNNHNNNDQDDADDYVGRDDELELMKQSLRAAASQDSSRWNDLVRSITPETLSSIPPPPTTVVEKDDHHHYYSQQQDIKFTVEEAQDWCIKVRCPLRYPTGSNTQHHPSTRVEQNGGERPEWLHIHVYFSAPPPQQHEYPNHVEDHTEEEMTDEGLISSSFLIYDLKQLIVQKATKSFLVHQNRYVLRQFEKGDFTLFHRDEMGDPVEVLTDSDFTHALSIQHERFVMETTTTQSIASSHKSTVRRKTLDLEVVIRPEEQQQQQQRQDQPLHDADDHDHDKNSNNNITEDRNDDHSNNTELPSSSSSWEESYWYQWLQASTKATENVITSLQDVTTSSVSHLRKTLIDNGQSLITNGQSIGKSLVTAESSLANRVAKCVLGASFAVAMVAIEQTAFTTFGGGGRRSYNQRHGVDDPSFVLYDHQESDTTYS